MRNDRVAIELIGVLIVIGIFVVVFGYLGVSAFYEWRTSQDCLAQGYSSYRFSMWGDDYCVLRKDQTDVVVPYATAMKQKAVP